MNWESLGVSIAVAAAEGLALVAPFLLGAMMVLCGVTAWRRVSGAAPAGVRPPGVVLARAVGVACEVVAVVRPAEAPVGPRAPRAPPELSQGRFTPAGTRRSVRGGGSELPPVRD